MPTVNLPVYCLTVEQLGWQEGLTRVIAGEVLRHRQARKLSAQKLADRCEELGFAVSRAVIANLENGHRETVSIAELLILAQALEVPPALLLFPLGTAESTAIAPGRELSPWDAVLWFSGQALLSETPHGLEVIWADEDDVVPLYYRHDQLVSQWEDQGRHAGERLIGPDGETIELQKETVKGVRLVRTLMRKKDLIPPPLPPELAHIDKQKRGPWDTGAAPAGPQPVVAAIVTSVKGILVGRRIDGTPPWGFIAGEIEPGERPEDAAVREVKEETGLEVRIGDEIGRRVHPRTGRTMIYVAARPARGTKVIVGDEAELAEVRWASLSEADELLPGMFGPVRAHLARVMKTNGHEPGAADDGID